MQKTVITGAAFSSLWNKPQKNNPSQCYSLPALISPLSVWKIINFKKQEIDLDKDSSLKRDTVVMHTAIYLSLKMELYLKTWFNMIAMMWSVEILKILRDSPSISQQCWLFVRVAIKMLNHILMRCIRNAEQGVIVEYS